MRRYLPCLLALMLMTTLITPSSGEEEIGAPTRAEGNILYVSETGSTWSNISDAIDNATSGDTIMIAPGNYSSGFLLLKDSINIIGNHTQGDVNIKHIGSEAIIGISSDRSNISGLNIIGEGTHLFALMCSASNNVTFRDIVIRSLVSDGFFLRDCYDINIEGMEISSGIHHPMEMHDIDRMMMKNFSFDTIGSRYSVGISGGCYDITYLNGSISMNDEFSIVFRTLDGLDLTIDDVDTTYQDGFIKMEMGEVEIFDSIFNFEDVIIDSTDVNDTVKVFFRKDIRAYGEDRYGRMGNISGVELNLTTDAEIMYRTPFYGGTDDANINLSYRGPFSFLSRNYTGGGFPSTANEAYLQAYYPEADMNGSLEIMDLNLSNTDPIIIEFRDIWFTNGTIFGQVKYDGGPLNNTPVANASVQLFIPLSAEDLKVFRLNPIPDYSIGNLQWAHTNSTGHYEFMNISFGHHLGITIGQEDMVIRDGNISGYYHEGVGFAHILRETLHKSYSYIVYFIDTTGQFPDTQINISVPYYEYIPPMEGPISGTVKFNDKGPKANETAPNVTVSLFNITGDRIGETLSDENGNYTFSNITFGEGYELRAMPSPEDLGINNNRTGYLFWDGSGFDHTGDTVFNISLKYFQYVEPVIKHPKVFIIDDNNDPLDHVMVTITTGEDEFTAFTNEDGIAEFRDIDGIELPDGAVLKAEKDGYTTIEWNQGDGIPKMEEEPKRGDDILLVWVLIGMIILILGFGMYLMMKKGKSEGHHEE